LAEAVTWAIPTLCGVQTVPAESHRPAQATPPAAGTKLKTLGLLEVKVIGVVNAWFEEFFALAVNCNVDPTSMAAVLGVRVMAAAVGSIEVVFEPPHPIVPADRRKRRKTANTPEPNRLMHPPRPPWRVADESVELLENCQFRGRLRV
jgi:hypothetical protein